jgi:hypothetical protein
MGRNFFLAGLVGVVAGCAAPAQDETVILMSSFDAKEAGEMMAPGTNSLRGSALIRQRGGGVVTCAGKEVRLIPATAYATERMMAAYGNISNGFIPATRKITFGGGDQAQYARLTKTTTCDAQGYFKFDHVANDTFYVVTVVTWQVNQNAVEGGSLMQSVPLMGSETKEIVLAP